MKKALKGLMVLSLVMFIGFTSSRGVVAATGSNYETKWDQVSTRAANSKTLLPNLEFSKYNYYAYTTCFYGGQFCDDSSCYGQIYSESSGNKSLIPSNAVGVIAHQDYQIVYIDRELINQKPTIILTYPSPNQSFD